MARINLNKDDIDLILASLDELTKVYGILAGIPEPKRMAIAQRVEQLKEKLNVDANETTDRLRDS